MNVLRSGRRIFNRELMIRRLIRWALYAVILFVVLFTAGILLMDTIVRQLAVRQVRRDTGMDVKIGRMEVGLFSPTITIENLKLYNTAEFGGGEFLNMPELHVEYDLAAARAGRLHLKLLRLNLAEIHVVENKDGKKNTDLLVLKDAHVRPPGKKAGTAMEFAGIDVLNVTIDRSRFTSHRHPEMSLDRRLGLRNEIFGAKNQKELDSVEVALALKAGLNILIDGMMGPPRTAGSISNTVKKN